MSRPANPRATGTAFLAIGIPMFAIGLAGQQSFLGVGIPFLVLGIASLRKKAGVQR